MHVLILAGTSEATELVGELVDLGHEVESSFAGVTATRRPRPGAVRVGGFGGTEGLVEHLQETGTDVLIDATHPFAAVMPHHAAAAARIAGIAHVRLLRPGWEPQIQDRWHRVETLSDVPEVLDGLGSRSAFLAIGRQHLGVFENCQRHLVVRSIEPVEVQLPDAVLIEDRGPFTVDREVELLTTHGVDVVVTKDAGGEATSAKLEAARLLRLAVVVVDRPAQPADVTIVATVADAVAFVDQVAGGADVSASP